MSLKFQITDIGFHENKSKSVSTELCMCESSSASPKLINTWKFTFEPINGWNCLLRDESIWWLLRKHCSWMFQVISKIPFNYPGWKNREFPYTTARVFHLYTGPGGYYPWSWTSSYVKYLSHKMLRCSTWGTRKWDRHILKRIFFQK